MDKALKETMRNKTRMSGASIETIATTTLGHRAIHQTPVYAIAPYISRLTYLHVHVLHIHFHIRVKSKDNVTEGATPFLLSELYLFGNILVE